MPRFTILTFAAAREIVGAGSFALELPDGATVADLRAAALDRYPDLAGLRDFVIARNEVYALPEEVLERGDELVIIPPVSGG